MKKIIIVGGGSAGWLTAGIIAAEHKPTPATGLEITLIESPDVATIGVGEGTWPTMQVTLQKMGINEREFLLACDASFKQGTQFVNWRRATGSDVYYHPFNLPQGYQEINLVPHWQKEASHLSFDQAVSTQSVITENCLAPKQVQTPDYAYVNNYGYHLDAGKFAPFLQQHCVEKLGVKHIRDHVVEVISAENGDIAAINTAQSGRLEADLFIDCTGFASLLLGKHFNVPFISKKDNLFIDTALAIQVPYKEQDSPIASTTISTAQTAGWIWDIGLSSRRGTGHVFSSAHISEDEAAQQLKEYIRPSLGDAVDKLEPRKIPIVPGHRKDFWHKNCVGIGLAAGFIEPLEASALVLIELSASSIAEQLPRSREAMDIIAKRFNQKFTHHWSRLIDFLKLHYVLTERTEPFWKDNQDPQGIPAGLVESLKLWKTQSPWRQDFPLREELFPSASYQYILYGMGFLTEPLDYLPRSSSRELAIMHFQKNSDRARQLKQALPTNRQLLQQIANTFVK